MFGFDDLFGFTRSFGAVLERPTRTRCKELVERHRSTGGRFVRWPGRQDCTRSLGVSVHAVHGSRHQKVKTLYIDAKAVSRDCDRLRDKTRASRRTRHVVVYKTFLDPIMSSANQTSVENNVYLPPVLARDGELMMAAKPKGIVSDRGVARMNHNRLSPLYGTKMREQGSLEPLALLVPGLAARGTKENPVGIVKSGKYDRPEEVTIPCVRLFSGVGSTRRAWHFDRAEVIIDPGGVADFVNSSRLRAAGRSRGEEEENQAEEGGGERRRSRRTNLALFLLQHQTSYSDLLLLISDD